MLFYTNFIGAIDITQPQHPEHSVCYLMLFVFGQQDVRQVASVTESTKFIPNAFKPSAQKLVTTFFTQCFNHYANESVSYIYSDRANLFLNHGETRTSFQLAILGVKIDHLLFAQGVYGLKLPFDFFRYYFEPDTKMELNKVYKTLNKLKVRVVIS